MYTISRVYKDVEEIFREVKVLHDEGLFGAVGASEITASALEKAHKVSSTEVDSDRQMVLTADTPLLDRANLRYRDRGLSVVIRAGNQRRHQVVHREQGPDLRLLPPRSRFHHANIQISRRHPRRFLPETLPQIPGRGVLRQPQAGR